MKKIFILFMIMLASISIVSCSKAVTLDTPTNVSATSSGLIVWDPVENATSYVITINGTDYTCKDNFYQIADISETYVYQIKAVSTNKKYLDSSYSSKMTFNGVIKPVVTVNATIGISGSSEVKSNQSTTLKAVIEGTTTSSVVWSITEGSEYATISQNGKVTATEVDSDKIIVVKAAFADDDTIYATKALTIVSKPVLTQEMLDELNADNIGFEGYINISLYTIGLFEKLYTTYTTQVKTSMNGTNWYAEYENGDTGTTVGLYYKNYNGTACQVGVSFMNEEEYSPLLDDNGSSISWTDSGLYNNFKNLQVSDFKFNEEIWRYEYVGSDSTLAEKVISSANPYTFSANGFALIIEDGEILGIYAKSGVDYTIVEGYKAIQELIVAVNTGDSVEVPTIGKYSHEDIHDQLNEAIANMHALTSYRLTYKEISASYYSSSYTQSGYEELITSTDCLFTPYDVSYDTSGNEIHTFDTTSRYGYHKISDTLYNSFTASSSSFTASRAYNATFDNASPSFAFAAEIFREYYIDEEAGTITYYVDDVMCTVASTFYYGLGNDINLYGIFATRGYTSTTSSFTPYVTIKDGYIVDAGFYFYLGSIYGVIELTYDNFNETTLPEDVNIEFETRQVPTSWSELTIEVSNDSITTADDIEMNALEYLKVFYDDENIADTMPFFGTPLGDTYGFGLTTVKIPSGTSTAVSAIVFYYDVPLDIDYTIDSSLRAIEEYLLDLGFTKNSSGEFTKGNIVCLPTDSSLDLLVYVWKN